MNRIIIVAPNSKDLSIYLQNQIDAQVEVYDDVYQLNERVRNSPLRAGTLLIRDEGFHNNALRHINLKEAGAMLMEVLTDNMFEVNRVIFLNVEKNSNHREVMKFIEGSKDIEFPMSIITRDIYTAALVKDILMRSNLEFDVPEKTFRYVIKRNRDDVGAIDSKILEGGETDKSVILEYPTMNPNIEGNKQRLTNIIGNEPLNQPRPRNIKQIDPMNVEIEDMEVKKSKPPTQIIGVIGDSKSGATTTAMILGTSASQEHKTLLVDMNYDNMGLSYLTEKVPIPDDINRIVMSDIIQQGRAVQYLRDRSFDRRKLHILGVDLPSKRVIDKEEFGFFVSNILTQLQKSYQYMILDIPFEDVKYYKGLLNQLDMIILTTPPFINNIVPMLQKMDKNFSDMPIYNDMVGTELTRIKCIRTNIFATVPNRINPIDKGTIERYSKEITGRTFPITGIYEFSGNSFLDTSLFQQLILLNTTEKDKEDKLYNQRKKPNVNRIHVDRKKRQASSTDEEKRVKGGKR